MASISLSEVTTKQLFYNKNSKKNRNEISPIKIIKKIYINLTVFQIKKY